MQARTIINQTKRWSIFIGNILTTTASTGVLGRLTMSESSSSANARRLSRKRRFSEIYDEDDDIANLFQTMLKTNLLCTVQDTALHCREPYQREKRPCFRSIDQVTFQSVTTCLSDKRFCRALRMSREAFQKQLSLVGRKLEKNKELRERSGYAVISPDMCLGITLRMLAGVSYLDIAWLSG